MNPILLDAIAGGGAGGMTSLGTLFTEFGGWMTEIVTTMTASGNEIMLLPVGIFVVGGAIGLASRLIGR